MSNSEIKTQLAINEGYKIIDEIIENKILNLGNGKIIDRFLNSVFINCSIIFSGSANKVSIKNVKFKNCLIKIQKSLSNFQFLECYFEDCIFEGKFIGCRFGNYQNLDAEVNMCDFTKANMHLCDFHENCYLNTNILPKWPCITIKDIEKNKENWLSIDFPDDFKITQKLVYESLKTTSAITIDISTYQNELYIWALIQDLEYIEFQDKILKPKIEFEQVTEIKNNIKLEEENVIKTNKIKEKYRIWNLFNQVSSIENIEKNKNNYKFYINIQTLSNKIKHSPNNFEIFLIDVEKANFILNNQEKEIVHWEEKFRIMSVKITTNEVILGGHKKSLGKINLIYDHYHLVDENGNDYSIDNLEKLVYDFYDITENF